ncbi:GH15855 [Drosophila grimshawi]|uniref:GH15855 n=1 Tax=Drosophila grimshawi TaxID=7222 RepID=B4J0A6_DROGR|nr:GH15855 [Drosophila grimshawi]
MWKKLIFCCCVGFLTVRHAKVLKCIHVKSRVLFDFQCVAHLTYTNLKCNSSNRNIGEFDYCYIKAVNRTYKYISLYYKLYKRPLSNITLNIQMLRKSNGYKPFTPNLEVDICKFLQNQRNPIMAIFYKSLKQFSNLNHTCPYITDVYVDKMHPANFESDFGRYIPIPEGDYALCFHFLAKKVEICNVCIFCTIFN